LKALKAKKEPLKVVLLLKRVGQPKNNLL
jgi:hypothetical protein